MLLLRIINYLKRKTNITYLKHKVSYIGKNVSVISPLHFKGRIRIGKNAIIHYKSWIEANPLTGAKEAELIIGEGCIIGHFNEIYATKSITLEDNVLTADRVYI